MFRSLDRSGREERCECVSHVYGLHNDAEAFEEKVFEYVYKDLSLHIGGVKQVAGNSEGWTWVNDMRFCVLEAK